MRALLFRMFLASVALTAMATAQNQTSLELDETYEGEITIHRKYAARVAGFERDGDGWCKTFVFESRRPGSYWVDVSGPCGRPGQAIRERGSGRWLRKRRIGAVPRGVRTIDNAFTLEAGGVIEIVIFVGPHFADLYRLPDRSKFPFEVRISTNEPEGPKDRLSFLKNAIAECESRGPGFDILRAEILGDIVPEICDAHSGSNSWGEKARDRERQFRIELDSRLDAPTLKESECAVALQFALKSLEIFEEDGDRRWAWRQRLHFMVGDLLVATGEGDEAIGHYKRAEDLARSVHGEHSVVEATFRIAAVHESKGNLTALRRVWKRLENVRFTATPVIRAQRPQVLGRVGLAMLRNGLRREANRLATVSLGVLREDVDAALLACNSTYATATLLCELGRRQDLASLLDILERQLLERTFENSTSYSHGLEMAASLVERLIDHGISHRLAEFAILLDRLFDQEGLLSTDRSLSAFIKARAGPYGRFCSKAARLLLAMGAPGRAAAMVERGIALRTTHDLWMNESERANDLLLGARIRIANGELARALEILQTLASLGVCEDPGIMKSVNVLVGALHILNGDDALTSEFENNLADAVDADRRLVVELAAMSLARRKPIVALQLLPRDVDEDESARWRLRAIRCRALLATGDTDGAKWLAEEICAALAGQSGSATDHVLAEATLVKGHLEARAGRISSATDEYRRALDLALTEPTAAFAAERGNAFLRHAYDLDEYSSALISILLRTGESPSSSDHARIAAAKSAVGWLRTNSQGAVSLRSAPQSIHDVARLRALRNGVRLGDESDIQRLEDSLRSKGLEGAPWRWRANFGRPQPGGTLLLAYYEFDANTWFGGEPKSQRRLAVVAASGNATHIIDLGTSDAIEAAVRTFARTKFGQYWETRGIEFEEDGGVGSSVEEVYKRLWGPVAEHASTCKKVVVIPAGPVDGFPLGVLSDQKGHYLIEDLEFTYLDGAWQLVERARKFSRKPLRALLVGGVDFSSWPNTEVNAQGWDPLPGSRSEVESIAEFARNGSRPFADVRVLSGGMAVERMVTISMSDSQLIHIASHGFVTDDPRSEVSSNSGVVLAHSTGGGDGLLRASELAWMNGGEWELVVLSACHGARGAQVRGEGLASVRRGFHLAGAKRVISACWAVPDSATKELMEAFYYQLWRKRKSPSQALRLAQLDLLRQARRAGSKDGAPASWGAWLFSGVDR